MTKICHGLTDRCPSPSFRMSKWNPMFAGACICVGILFSVGTYLLSRISGKAGPLFDCTAPSIELCNADDYFITCRMSCAYFTQPVFDNEQQPIAHMGLLQQELADEDEKSASGSLIVKIFYEADCSDTRSFFTGHFGPLLKKLPSNFSSFIDFKLYPYGKAIEQPDGTITCQHGPHECEGNQAMACALFLARSDWARLLRFIVCFMREIGANSVEERALDCDRLIGEQIRSCSQPNSQLGNKLLKELGSRTRALFGSQLPWVPWIVVGSDASKATSEQAEYGLADLLCKTYKLCFP